MTEHNVVQTERTDESPNQIGAILANRSKDKCMILNLAVTDPEVISALEAREEGDARNAYAISAMRIGIVTLRQATGHLDAVVLADAGNKLIDELGSALQERGLDLSNQLNRALTQYFDPTTGLLTQRLQSLTQKDGELERLLQSQMGPSDSVLAKTLVSHLGEGSQIFNLLSPTHSSSLKVQMERLLEDALSQQREKITNEFSLDNKESALSRLILEITSHNEKLGVGLAGRVDGLVDELSLDRPDSALSRLIGRVEQANHSIADQFSSDNENSALSKLSKILYQTNLQISKNLSLDDESSALARLRREFQTAMQELSTRNSAFHLDVKTTLTELQARKREADLSTRHGLDFERELERVVAKETQDLGDVWQSTGTTTGSIKNCKVGDFVTILGRENTASGTRIVWEAKEDKSYDLRKALEELEVARKNREAYIGIFVFSKRTAPESLKTFARYGQDIVIVWDLEDPSSDIYIKAAHSVAKALAFRNEKNAQQQTLSLEHIEQAVRGVERQIKQLDEFKTWADTIVKNGQKIADRSDKMRIDLQKEIDKLDFVRHLRSEQPIANSLVQEVPSIVSNEDTLF